MARAQGVLKEHVVAVGKKKCLCIKFSDGPSDAWPSLSQCSYFQLTYEVLLLEIFYTRCLENLDSILSLFCYLSKGTSGQEKGKKYYVKYLEGKFDDVINHT